MATATGASTDPLQMGDGGMGGRPAAADGKHGQQPRADSTERAAETFLGHQEATINTVIDGENPRQYHGGDGSAALERILRRLAMPLTSCLIKIPILPIPAPLHLEVREKQQHSLTDLTEHAGSGYTRSPSLGARSPDTASPVFPERAIRPLPKSRLKSKLSPEQASTIIYPPDPPPISPTLSFSAQENGTPVQQRRLTNGDAHHHHHHHHEHTEHSHCTCGEDGDSGEDEVEFDHPDYRYPLPTSNGAPVKPVDSLQRRLVDASRAANKPPPPGSTASSADGYESFENTSNKKKRKIPLSGASSMHQSQLSAEMANMGISNTHADGAADEHGVNGIASPEEHDYSAPTPPATSSASGTGISGAGRGRFGKSRNRPAIGNGTSTDKYGNVYSRAPARGDARTSSDPSAEHTGGIISQAIKTAAEQGPLTPAGKGRDNVSLLQSATSANNSSTPNKTQFTFTCESDSATKMVDQQATAAHQTGTPTPARNAASPAGKHAHGTQTTPTLRNGQQPTHATRPPPPPSNAGPQQQAPPPPKPKPRRNPTKEYALQAAQRKRNQQYQNYHHRPKPEDMWICEFCEYEDIYGTPPLAMIRRYEIKDRQERKKAAEKRRLLEKAKMKGRKNKKGAGKGGKNNNNNAPAPATPVHAQNYDPNLPPADSEEYYDDEEYDGDDYDPVGTDDQYDGWEPPPAPAGTPAIPAGGGGQRNRNSV
ncbi:Hypothetical predicted protein [Lecanosticta acicola]|uniref:Uncharacterized protein n=1 Tax=Lecanosticta acicola TaxID=111012 RepID=A0AAI9EEC2_9PEZI|nr:Hypothetical predicted protein [Lecanosticta acicola]